MIRDPEHRGLLAAQFYASVAPRLFHDIVEAGVLPAPEPDALQRARSEWECFALYACVRGLVAAGGFNQETGRALDAMHEAALSDVTPDTPSAEGSRSRRELVSERYSEYGAIGQDGGAAGAATVGQRLGVAAAAHMASPATAGEELATLVAAMHEALVEGVAEAVRQAEDG